MARSLPATLFAALALAQAGAHAQRAAIEPLKGVQVSYERQGEAASPPGRFDGAITTPLGTVRTSVRTAPGNDRPFQRGDTSFELPTPFFNGQLQLRELESGGRAAAWRARLPDGLAMETHSEWTPVRSAQALHLQQRFGDGHLLRAQLSTSQTATAQGSRWDLELSQATRLVDWSAGIDGAEREYVSAWNWFEPRFGVRLAAQWLLFPHARMEARYSRHVRWDNEQASTWMKLGTRFDLPWRLSFVTAVETDVEQRPKASLTLSVPLHPR